MPLLLIWYGALLCRFFVALQVPEGARLAPPEQSHGNAPQNKLQAGA